MNFENENIPPFKLKKMTEVTLMVKDCMKILRRVELMIEEGTHADESNDS